MIGKENVCEVELTLGIAILLSLLVCVLLASCTRISTVRSINTNEFLTSDLPWANLR